MSLGQHIRYGVGGTVHLDLLDRPANALCSAYKGDGAQVWASRTCTVSSANTIINAAVAAGDWSVNVVSNVGISAGGKFWLQDDPEELLCRKVAAGVIHLRRPAMLNHVINALVEGTRISYAANSSDANGLFWDGHIDWNIEGKVTHQTALECTKYSIQRVATAQDIFDEEPMFGNLKDEQLDVERTLDLAHQDVLLRIAAKNPDARARVFPASSEFVQATVFAFMERFYRRRPGEENRQIRGDYEKKLTEEVDCICGVLPSDANQDGAVGITERLGWSTIKVRR